MEVCVDSIQSAIDAEKGGACRIELCSSLALGGITPSDGFIKVVKKSISIPVYVLIRPREGDFLYSKEEKDVIVNEVSSVLRSGADGIVIGALRSDGEIDIDLCKQIMEISCGKPVTFHRAFDMTSDPIKSLELIQDIGITRLLTSGQSASAHEGIDLLKKLQGKANGRIVIMPGGGITEDNLLQILQCTGVKEFHTSAKTSISSKMDFQNNQATMGSSSNDYSWKVCSSEKARRMLDIANKIWNS